MIYFDNSATTAVKPQTVAQAVYQVLSSGEYGNPGRDASSYSLNSSEVIYEARCLVKQLFNGKTEDNVIFTKSVTESLNLIINGLLKQGDHVITTNYEHNSVIRPLERRKQAGEIEVTYTPFDPKTGVLDLNYLKSAIKKNTRAIICTHVSNVSGYILPIAELAKVCQEHHLLFILDAAQSAGIENIDVQQTPIDVLCFTGHKSLYGPQGVGGFYLNDPLTIAPLLTGGSGFDSFNKAMPEILPNKFEAGTMNTPGIAGLRSGLQYVESVGLDAIQQKLQQLSGRIKTALSQYPEVKLYTGEVSYSPSIVAFNVGQMDSAEVCQYLWDDYQIATRGGAHCAPLVHQTYQTQKQGIVRVSLSYFNTDAEVTIFLEAMQKLIQELRDDDHANQ